MDSQSIKQKIQQIQKELNDAVSLVNAVKKQLVDLETGLGVVPSKSILGLVGKFTGDCMVADDGQKYDVPSNYASKSVLVVGDKLKMYEEGSEKKFKQIERVKRFRTEGILAKKEGKWHVVTSDSSYRVLDVSVNHFGAVEGDMVIVLLPLDDRYVTFAALESVVGKKVLNAENLVSVKSVEVKPVEKAGRASTDRADRTPVASQPVTHIETVVTNVPSSPAGEIELANETAPPTEEIKVSDESSTVVRSTPSNAQTSDAPKAPVVEVVASPTVVVLSRVKSNNFKKKKSTGGKKVTPAVVRVVPSEAKKVVVSSPVPKPPETPVPEPSRVLDDEDLR